MKVIVLRAPTLASSLVNVAVRRSKDHAVTLNGSVRKYAINLSRVGTTNVTKYATQEAVETALTRA